MEEFSLHEISSSPNCQTDNAEAKAENICLRCGGFAVACRDISSKLEYMVSTLCHDARTNVF